MNYRNPDNSQPACKQFRDLLDSWLSKELHEDIGLFMQSHQQACPACQQEKQLAMQIDEISHTLPELKCPPLSALNDLVHTASEYSRQPGLLAQLLAAWKQPLVLVPACAALLTAVLVISIITTKQSQEPQLLVINGEEYTEQEVRQAVEDLEMALQYIDKYSRYPGQIVTAELTESPLPLRKRDDTEVPPI